MERDRRIDYALLGIIAAGVFLGFAVYELVFSLVRGLIAPGIAAFVGERHFQLNAFVAGGSEFRYGEVLEIAFVVFLAAVVIRFLVPGVLQRISRSDVRQRECPECKSQVPVAARRCAYCTSPLAAEAMSE
jgi:large conductance mechanosensitive channel